MTVPDTPAGVAAQQAALDALYRCHAFPGMAYALLDFPDHANVGDSAIWLGEVAMLRAVTGRGPSHVATWHDFDPAALRRDCPEGVVFLHGGGNLGDIWPHHQHLRERVLAEMGDRTVVQLPQSIHFRDAGNARQFAELATAHADFTLYVRDARSVAFAAGLLGCGATLAPDSALALGMQPRGRADCPLLMLLRSDDERRGHGDAALPPGTRTADWLVDDPRMDASATTPDAREAQARARVDRGLRLLSQGEAIVTDRLHAHILATLLAIPHVVLDNDYGKIGAYRAAWPATGSPVRAAATLAAALDAADGIRPRA